MLSLVLDDGEGEGESGIRKDLGGSNGEAAGAGPAEEVGISRPAGESRERASEAGRSHLQPSSALTQLTVNEYLPGQGIAQHIGRMNT